MRRFHILAAILSMVALLAPQVAWGCETADMSDCGPSDCPMKGLGAEMDCHDSAAASVSTSLWKDCALEGQVWVACCATPSHREPAQAELQVSAGTPATPPCLAAERVESQPADRPPDLAARTVSSQQHQLGRFTLLSSFLI